VLIPKAAFSLTQVVKRVRRARTTGMEAQAAAISATALSAAAAYRAAALAAPAVAATLAEESKCGD